MRTESYKFALAVLAILGGGLSGCGILDNTDTNKENAKILGNDDSKEWNGREYDGVNDTYERAQNVKFGDNGVLSITGTGNSSDDEDDWYTFTAPETGIYICGFKTEDPVNFDLNAYQAGHYSVGGSDGNIYTYSDNYKDAGYNEITWISMPNGKKHILKGSKIYLDMHARSTGGNNVEYTIDCFLPSIYDKANQTGRVDENNSLINYYRISALPFTLDSSKNATIHGMGNSSEDRQDYYKFTSPVSGDYNITLQHDDTVDFDLNLYNKDDSRVEGVTYNGSTSPQQWSFTAMGDAEYYIKITAANTGGNNAAYTVQIEKQ